MSNETCLFCKIVRREIPAHIVYEDQETLALLDIHPRAPGHTMVISKVHGVSISAMPPEALPPLFQTVQKVAQRLMTVLAPDGMTIGINQGDVSGQTVPHLHIHLLPRFKGDGGGSIHTIVDNAPQESPQHFTDLLKF